MSIRPIDMQVILPRVDQSFYAKQNVVHRNENEQASSAQINREDAERKLNTVQDLKDSARSDYIKRERHQKHENHERDSGGDVPFFHHEQKDEAQSAQNEAGGHREDKNYNSQGKLNQQGGKIFDFKI